MNMDMASLKENLLTSYPNCNIVNVCDLVKTKHSFHVDLTNTHGQTESKLSSNDKDGARNELERKHLLLQGKICADIDGSLQFTDGRNKIRCFIAMSVSDVNFFNTDLICTSWNYIYSASNVFLELNSVERLHEIISEESICCLNVKAASLLLSHRDVIGRKLLSVCGKVSTMSETFQLRGDTVFLFRMTDKGNNFIDILVKNKKFLYLQYFLTPQTGRDVIVTGLLATTLYKETLDERRIFLLHESGSVYQGDKVSKSLVGLENWVKTNRPETDLLGLVGKVPTKRHSLATKLMSYQGAITSTSDSEKGIYELDGKVRLYVTYIPAVHEFRHLRIGTKVTVYNAHQVTSLTPPRLRLCGCMVTCVKVNHFTSQDSPATCFRASTSLFPHMLTRFSLDVTKLDWLIVSHQKLIEKFVPSLVNQRSLEALPSGKSSGSLSGGALYNLFARSGSIRLPWLLKENVRNFLKEFLLGGQGHTGCSVIGSGDNSDLGRVKTIQEVISQCELDAKNYDALELCAGTSKSSESFQWNYKITKSTDLNPPWILAGMLHVNKVTGHVELKDQTGVIQCVTARSLGADIKQASEEESCTDKYQGSYSACETIQTWDIGKIVRVDKFDLVIERFVESQSSTESGTCGSNLKIYIQFSMNDVVCLKHPPSLHKTLEKQCRKSKTESPSISKRPRVDTNEQTAVCHAESQQHPAAKNVQLKPEMASSSCVCQLLLVTQKDALRVKATVNSSSRLQFNALATCIGNPQVLFVTKDGFQSNQPGLESQTFLQSSQEELSCRLVALTFQGDNVRWYPVIYTGCLYRLVKPNCSDVSTFKQILKPEKLQRLLDSTGTRQNVQISDDVLLVKVDSHAKQDSSGGEHSQSELRYLTQSEQHTLDELRKSEGFKHELKPVLEVLDLKNQKVPCLVRFQGVVVRRFFDQKPGKRSQPVSQWRTNMGVSAPGNGNISLIVRDRTSQEEIKVYITHANLSYPLGMLKGNIVCFEKVELRRSKTHHLYCHFIVTSSLTVLGFGDTHSPLPRSGEVQSGQEKSKEPPRINLADLWNENPTTSAFSTLCHINKVLKLLISIKCSSCCSLYDDGRCSSRSCLAHTGFPVSCKASVMIDDGTCNAIVYIQEPKKLQTLLNLNDYLWNKLQTEISKVGEISINCTASGRFEQRPQPFAVERFLLDLCKSSHVVRPLVIAARCFKDHFKDLEKSPNDFELRPVPVGYHETIETRTLPLLQLYCINVVEVNYTQQLLHHISNTS